MRILINYPFSNQTEVMESPRYGTLRRQKPNAPSPPAKSDATTNGGGTLNHSHTQTYTRPHAKELFPQEDNKHATPEKPAKPPQPNLAQLQTSVTQPSAVTQLEPLPPPPVTPAKPVPMTRTQFFGLDNLPSPTADRRSIDSIGSFRLKPDVPQKPQLPKRPMVLSVGTGSGLKGDSKSDDESITPTQAKIDNGNGTVRYTTEKFIEKLRQENCDTNGTREDSATTTTTTTAPTIAATTAAATTTGTATTTSANTNANAEKENNHNNHEPQPALATETTNNTQKEHQTPTTPISPNSFHTPKRPTVPAPPPPTIRKAAD